MQKKWYLLIGLVSINALHAMHAPTIILRDFTNKPEAETASPIPSPNPSPRYYPSPKRIAKLLKNIKKWEGNPDKASECSKLLIQLQRLQSENK